MASPGGQNTLQPPTGPNGRRLHIAHRRSPSEMTPLMMEQLALQQQIDQLQQQQQQIAATRQQYLNMGIMQQQQQQQQAQQQQQMGNPYGILPNQIPGMPQNGNFQFPQQFQQQQGGLAMSMHSAQAAHRRNVSALPGGGLGPPPAPSSGASGSAFGDFSQQPQTRENVPPRGGRGGPAGGHHRRHSLALPEAKKAAELAEQKRKTSGFQFPIPGGAGATPQSPGQALSPSPGPESSESGPSVTANRSLSRGSSHGRSQSMAVGNGRGQLSGRGGSGFTFPDPNVSSDFQRRGSGHNRTTSRNLDNWRQPNQQPAGFQDQNSGNMGNFQAPGTTGSFQPGHRSRQSMNQSVSGFQFPAQPQLMQLPQGQVLMQPNQGMFPQQGGLNPMQLAQLQALQAAQANGQAVPGLIGSQHAPQLSTQQQQQQQRKTLFTPYLPQATLPALLADGQLVAGTLRVNKKNRSDAYVTTTDLDADIFICGSKDRNRALEGDLVAIELLDVDEVWSQKREKEEKKKRKDINDPRGSSNTTANDATTGGDNAPAEGGLRRRGSLRQRPTQKKNDDVEVEGQSLLLMEEEEINDEQKPLYAGHVVAVIERVAGQMFSGTLGLLRPSSQATKEKQEAERQARDGGNGRGNDRHQDKPKIVWFKPTDKRVPLIAIPTEQAPRDFVEKHQDYANRIFVACIKRWPITSLHPFGTLVEQLGEMGDPKVETDALLRDNNFGPDEFSDPVLKNVGLEDWSVEKDGEAALEGRRDLRSESVFSIDLTGSNELENALHMKTLADGNLEVGVHVADVAHFVKHGSLVDREAKKRGTGVYLMDRTVNMLPHRLSEDICCIKPNEDRYAVSVIFKVNPTSGRLIEADTWIGKSVIKSSHKLSYEEVNSILADTKTPSVSQGQIDQVKSIQQVAQKLRQLRFGDRDTYPPSLRLLDQLDDENIPVEQNIFDHSAAHELVEEIGHKANSLVAQQIYAQLGEKAWLRRQAPPNPRRLQTFAERMTRIGYDIDTASSGELQNSLFGVDDDELRKGMETLLIKSMQRAKYVVAGKTPAEELPHFALNIPVYTHFTNPFRRYADIIVHRQLEAALSNGTIDFGVELEELAKTADLCNTKKDSAQAAQEQSVHIESCRRIDKRREELGGDLICEGIVLCVYESAFDVLIPEYGFEKRVHCDQLPLKKAEFDKHKRVLELYWEKGVASSAYVPEDERAKPGSLRGGSFTTAAQSEASRRQRESEEARRHIDTGTINADDTDALFNDDDEDLASELADSIAGVSLNVESQAPAPEQPAAKSVAASGPESKLADKDRYLKMFTLREEEGNFIQDVTEMTRVPVILKTDLSKSPPCLTIRSVNPFAL